MESLVELIVICGLALLQSGVFDGFIQLCHQPTVYGANNQYDSATNRFYEQYIIDRLSIELSHMGANTLAA